MAEQKWQTMATAPRDGTPVWLCDREGEAGGPWPMRWDGIWELEGGGMTWTEEHADGAPTHWAPRTSDRWPTPPWIVQH